MPKEHVKSYYEGQPVLMTSVGSDEPAVWGDPLPAFRVEVGWDRFGSVQVATVDPEALLGSRESGLYVDLDRNGVNDLIRLLRKARDQSFGRDE